jgi:hypothetical protein
MQPVHRVGVVRYGLPWWGHLLYLVATAATCGFAVVPWVAHTWYANHTRWRSTTWTR